MGYSPWGGKESDMTECIHTHTHTHTHIPSTLPAANLLSVYMNLPILDISCTQNQHVTLYLWLLSLSIMFSGFIHVVACITISFLFMAE